MSTEDIPYLGSFSRKKGSREAGAPSAAADTNTDEVGRPVPLFDPVMVELNATILLRFLQVMFAMTRVALVLVSHVAPALKTSLRSQTRLARLLIHGCSSPVVAPSG